MQHQTMASRVQSHKFTTRLLIPEHPSHVDRPAPTAKASLCNSLKDLSRVVPHLLVLGCRKVPMRLHPTILQEVTDNHPYSMRSLLRHTMAHRLCPWTS